MDDKPMTAKPTTKAGDAFPAQTHFGPYKSEEEYLSALRAWAHEKEYVQPAHTTIIGFYGTRTVDDYIDQDKVRKRAEKKEKKRKEQEARRRGDATAAKPRVKRLLPHWLAHHERSSKPRID